MEDKAYKTIRDFCTANKHPQIYNRILLHKYYEDFYKVVSDHKIKEGSEPSDDTINGFQSTLLNDMTLKSNVKLAEDEIKNLTEKKVENFKFNTSLKEFGMNILSGIVASILYTIILIFFFYLGKNQINSWLNDLNNSSNNNITNTKKE